MWICWYTVPRSKEEGERGGQKSGGRWEGFSEEDWDSGVKECWKREFGP